MRKLRIKVSEKSWAFQKAIDRKTAFKAQIDRERIIKSCIARNKASWWKGQKCLTSSSHSYICNWLVSLHGNKGIHFLHVASFSNILWFDYGTNKKYKRKGFICNKCRTVSVLLIHVFKNKSLFRLALPRTESFVKSYQRRLSLPH